MNKPYSIFIAASALLVSVATAQAEDLLFYNFFTDLNPTQSASGVTGSTFTFGNFNGNGGGSTTYGRSTSTPGPEEDRGNLFARVKTSNSPSTDLLSNNKAGSIEWGNYFAFGLTNNTGSDLALGSFTASIGAQAIAASGGVLPAPYTAYYFLQYSTDNFATYTETDAISYYKDSANITFAADPWEIDLSAITLSSSESILFRIYAYVETTNPSLNQTVRLDNIRITAPAIPEPAYAALAMAVGIGGLLALRRRRQKRSVEG